MSLISNQAGPARRILAAMMHCRRAGARLYRARAVFAHQGTRRGAGAASALLAAFGLVWVAGVPQSPANGRDPLVPDAWRGTWEVTVSYRDHQTGALVATDVTTDAICPGEPIAPPLLNTISNLWGRADDRELKLSGQAKYSPRPGCHVLIEVKLDSRRDGDTWSGTGSWTARVVGNCEHLSFGEDFVVSGRRSTEAACDGEGASLVERFFAHSALIPALGGGTSHDR